MNLLQNLKGGRGVIFLKDHYGVWRIYILRGEKEVASIKKED